MATLFTTNYPVIETNRIAAVRTGQFISQYPLGASLPNGAQQGMLLRVVDQKVELPAAATDQVYLHMSEETMYEEHLGREHFKLTAPRLPRLAALNITDIFETNAVEMNAFNTGNAKGKLGIASTAGYISLVATATDVTAHKVVLEVLDVVSLPNGKPGIKFGVVKC